MAADDPRAELSSLSTILDDVLTRLGAIADAAANDEGPVAPELFEIERDLQAAGRRLTKLVADLG